MGKMLFLIVLLASACTAGPVSTQPPAGSTPTPGQMSTFEPQPFPTAQPAQDGPAALIRDLRAAGIEAEEGSEFAGEPISTLGMQLCVAGKPVQLYVFPTADAAAARAATIDPQDPSNFGTAMIEWAGEPKFWLRDRMLVLYLGTEQSVEDALVSVLGEPFARGQGRPPLPGGDEGC